MPIVPSPSFFNAVTASDDASPIKHRPSNRRARLMLYGFP
jgi:hypothetical protein